VTLELANVTGAASLGAQTAHTLTIQDSNDVAGAIGFVRRHLHGHRGGLATITVRRTGAASGVTVHYASEDPAGPGAATAGPTTAPSATR
jgi:hypothetical protein